MKIKKRFEKLDVLLNIIYLGSLLYYILGNLINYKKNNTSHHLHPVSVIVAVKNGDSSLNNLLQDLKKQTYEGQMEFIIVDDESNDKTKEIIKDLASKDLRFIYETSANGNQNLFFNEYLAIARAVSFSGFIAIPLVLFLLHNFGKNLSLINTYSYSFILLIWIISTQIFL